MASLFSVTILSHLLFLQLRKNNPFCASCLTRRRGKKEGGKRRKDPLPEVTNIWGRKKKGGDKKKRRVTTRPFLGGERERERETGLKQKLVFPGKRRSLLLLLFLCVVGLLPSFLPSFLWLIVLKWEGPFPSFFPPLPKTVSFRRRRRRKKRKQHSVGQREREREERPHPRHKRACPEEAVNWTAEER